MPASLVKMLQKNCLVSDMCAGPVPHNQTCVMVITSADPVAMMAAAVQTCLLVECFCIIGACWTVATQSACMPIFCHSILHVC